MKTLPSGWELPFPEELATLQHIQNNIQLKSTKFWSNMMGNKENAYFIDIRYGNKYWYNKTAKFNVIAVRRWVIPEYEYKTVIETGYNNILAAIQEYIQEGWEIVENPTSYSAEMLDNSYRASQVDYRKFVATLKRRKS